VVKTCGNKLIDSSSGEKCDDGNIMSGDGCNAACQIEANFECPTPGQPCFSVSICGNGSLTGSEACDDGNTAAGDGCAADCRTVEPGWQCRVPGKPCVPLCGDRVKTAKETCDDGNGISGDGCSSTCQTEPGFSCSDTGCTKSVCGNGIVEAGETCDKGKDNGLFYGDGSGCSKTCTPEPNCRTGGTTQACTTHCGDGNVDRDEQCDDGNQSAGDGCSATCRVEAGFTCTPQQQPDTGPCPSAPSKDCLVLPVIFRDFDGAQAGGHPDFLFVTATGPSGQKTICVPNASGVPAPVTTDNKCASTDATGPCRELVQPTLGTDGKPQLNTGRASGLTCACRFTDWDNTGVLNGQTQATPTSCWDDGGNERKRIGFTTPFLVQVIRDAASFGQWYHDSTLSTKVTGTLELAATGTGQYQFSSSVPGAVAGAASRTVYDDLHAIFMKQQTQLSSGFFPLESQPRPKVCNIWPYWLPALATNCAAGDGYPVASQWDPLGSYTTNPPTAGTGGPVNPVTGVQRNFYFTTEVRYLFRYDGVPGTLSFFGDDDVWVFVNGRLALDLGAPHERIQGEVQVNASYGLEAGKVYEIAVFHADRHPRESNYQLTLSGFSTTRSLCQPRCGDGVPTAGEECDLGTNGNTGEYGGCTAECKLGPFCGDGVINGSEVCDNGSKNGAVYGADGCTTGCTRAHYCGDGIIDSTFGEDCDGGPMCTSNCKFFTQ
jgi:fibro-slime domain-containing protein